MIKFFRKIRLNLLSEGNTSKYFKYAIGEIILVVIGILIALQINNWNDIRKEKNELKQYLAKISNNIVLDIKNLNVIKTRRQETNTACQKALANFQKDDYDLVVNMHAANAFIDFYFAPNQSGYEALKNSSYLGKINGTRVDSLIDSYNTIVNKTISEENSYFNFIESMEVIWTSKYDMSEFISLYMNQNILNEEELDDNLKRKLKATFADESFRSSVTRCAVQTQMIQYYDELIHTGKELINEIKKISMIKFFRSIHIELQLKILLRLLINLK
ncbi:DUF6090 family protein [Psychroserpens sp. SPM9]|uniref:DUF6090 family protein n=1 Tax=Psychroserpens sp. SPM9 TaxID=2975598 RepID=UPI0021A7BB51|nr:DUF6090 family protein [Psychroserpens sp. SPM9]